MTFNRWFCKAIYCSSKFSYAPKHGLLNKKKESFPISAATALDVCLAKLKHQIYFSTIGQFLGPITRSHVVLYRVVPAEALNLESSREQ